MKSVLELLKKINLFYYNMEKNDVKCVPKDIDRICAPGKKFSEGSCFSMKQLKKIAESKKFYQFANLMKEHHFFWQ